MNTNRKIMLALATMALAAPGAMADQIQAVGSGGNINGYGPWQTNLGGEFTLLIKDTPSDPAIIGNLDYYNSNAKNIWQDGTFQTFCVEGGEYIYGWGTSDVTVNDHTVYGGSLPAQTLTAGAAWLYWQFAGIDQTLDGYDYTAAGRHASADLLQKALWAFMGGQDGETLVKNANNPFVLAAYEELGTGEFGAERLNGGQYPVSVLNLWGVGGTARQQDQLILTGQLGDIPGAPDGGFTVTLLGMSLTGLAALRRKLRPAS